MKYFKVPSGELTNLPYLTKIAKIKKPVILSTGMCTMDEVEAAVKIFYDNNSKDIILLHCSTEYPTPYSDVNLKAMISLKEKFGLEVGYSDHTEGIEVAVAAVGLGAVVIEKHFTIDKNMEGPDHIASLEPDELTAMTRAIRNVEDALGDGIKKPCDSEKENIEIVRKSIVASRYIKKGEIFNEDNLTSKRPGNGISPMRWYDLIGKISDRDYEDDEQIRE